MFAMIEVGENSFCSKFGSKTPKFATMLALWGLVLAVRPPLARFAPDVLQSLLDWLCDALTNL